MIIDAGDRVLLLSGRYVLEAGSDEHAPPASDPEQWGLVEVDVFVGPDETGVADPCL